MHESKRKPKKKCAREKDSIIIFRSKEKSNFAQKWLFQNTWNFESVAFSLHNELSICVCVCVCVCVRFYVCVVCKCARFYLIRINCCKRVLYDVSSNCRLKFIAPTIRVYIHKLYAHQKYSPPAKKKAQMKTTEIK